MEHLGLWGIIKLSTHIILQNMKHFLCCAVMYALPSALCLLLVCSGPSILSFFCTSLQFLVASLSLLYQLSTSPRPLPPSQLIAFDDAIFSKRLLPPDFSLSLLIFLFTFSILISLICSPLVAFGVCRACINKSLDLKSSLRGLSRSAPNLLVTALSVAAAFLAFFAAAVLEMVIMCTVLAAMDADLAVAMTVWTIGVVGGGVYMGMALSVADVVAILEEKKGWEAMRRSVYLMKGNKGTAMGLYSGYGALSMVPILIYCEGKEGLIGEWRWRGAASCVLGGVLQGLIGLSSMAAHVVLYMSSKRQREEEPFDAVIASKELNLVPI